MGTVSKTHTAASGAVIPSSGINTNFDTLYTLVNGNVDNDNIKASAGIVATKLNLATIAQAIAMNASLTMGSIFKFAKGADVASATTTTLGADGNFFDITGTTTITSVTAKTAGTIVILQFDGILTFTDGSNLKLNGDFATAAGSVIALISDGTNWFEVSRTPENVNAGTAVQVVNTQTGATSSGTTAIPQDDTIPQNTEGDELMTLAITPTNTNNKLKIDVVVNHYHSTAVLGTIALFQDSTADALACALTTVGGTYTTCMTFTHYMTAGTTSSTTFKVRAGNASGTFVFNGNAGGRLMGGTCASSITITEIKV